ncbi:MAG: tetratricopeptide repeat protein [Azonexus sp.]|nr:tetratricopeptide repeat protein [Azonexus sp.]MCK6413165.1 tetratricopeptide repeat protein [Azonexus sp.]
MKPLAATATAWRNALWLLLAGAACGGSLAIYLQAESSTPTALAVADLPPQEKFASLPTQALTLPAPPAGIVDDSSLSRCEAPPGEQEAPPPAGPLEVEPEIGEHWEAARQALEKNDPATAEIHLRRLLKEYPEHAPGLRALALLRENSGRDASEAAMLRRLADNGRGETPESRAGAWLKREQPHAAGHIALLAHLHADSANLRFAQGVALGREGRWAEAAQAFRHNLRLGAEHPDTWYNLAVVHERRGEGTEASAAYRRALELAETLPHRFTPAAVAQRLQALETRQADHAGPRPTEPQP